MTKPITVIVVDDSALIRQMFSEMLSEEADIKVLDTASDPYDAREKIKRLNPDVLTLDIEMPKMDGLSFLEKIMTLRPMPVIMVSSLTQKGTEATLHALELGAFDYIAKPVTNQTRDTIADLKDELVAKVRAAAASNVARRGRARDASAETPVIPFHPPEGGARPIIAMGSSTGGVEALREIFLRLPANCPPIVITQHMPETFTQSFAVRLDSLSQVTVAEAANHDRLKQGHAYLAPGNRHLKIVRIGGDFVCKLEDGPPVSGHKPSVDVLFHSVADAAGSRAIGVILTGMGRDGALGLKAMHDAGSYNFGQDQASCVVYGMPQVAVKAGAVDIELPLIDIPAAILKFCEKKGASR
ncbi:MAG: chemotaxis response regulator protein-glutamate methylesterase [Alphaproteobacteria bacterium]|nr:chemotaxis response regulator protein-glutamate methylesterase [Alphaproteobacteria bacterium]